MTIRNTDTKPNRSLFKVLVSYFCGMLSYFVIGSIFAVLLSLVIGLLYSFDTTRSILDLIFFLRKDDADLFMVTTSCIFAAITTETIVRRINADNPMQAKRTLWGIGVSFLVIGVIMLMVNLVNNQAIIGNIFMILVGFYFRSTNKIDFHATPKPSDSSTIMNASIETATSSDIEMASTSKNMPKLKISNTQRVINVLFSLFIITSIGINIFLFTEIQRYNSQQDKLIDNVNYLLSSNEELREANVSIEEELKQTTWRSKINAFTSDELVNELGSVKAFWVKSNSKDWDFLNEIASSRLFNGN